MTAVVTADGILIGAAGAGGAPVRLLLNRANRHGLVAGATGTGKTATLQGLAEAFSAAGVPVFAADVKGDLSGVSQAGTPTDRLAARAEEVGVELRPLGAPTVFWDLFGERGHPIRATVSDMGPLLLSRLLELNDTQEGVLTVVFHVADTEGLLLLDLKDLQAALRHVAENSKRYSVQYGNVAPASVAAIQRKLLTLGAAGADGFFGEPALRLADLMRTDREGRGYVSVLAAERLIQSPRLYATFLLWLISELFEELPEVGDPDRPTLVFFFDEAHLLFRDAPRSLLEKVEQVVRLIRSKGVGVYFVTQNPADVPDAVLGQLGNRVQHALRAYTPADQKGLRAAADSFRPNPAFDTAETIQALGVGEALVSVLDERGAPTVTERTLVRPPNSRLGPASPAEREAAQAQSPCDGLYDEVQDRDSAYEALARRAQEAAAPAAARPAPAEERSPWERQAPRTRGPREEEEEAQPGPGRRASPRPRAQPRASSRQSPVEAFATSLMRSAANTLGREITRGLLGGRRRR